LHFLRKRATIVNRNNIFRGKARYQPKEMSVKTIMDNYLGSGVLTLKREKGKSFFIDKATGAPRLIQERMELRFDKVRLRHAPDVALPLTTAVVKRVAYKGHQPVYVECFLDFGGNEICIDDLAPNQDCTLTSVATGSGYLVAAFERALYSTPPRAANMNAA
jgi:hypothetical protein